MEGAERDDRPAINVTWHDAREYVAWLSEMTGAHYRLLTEAEWEFAARGVISADAANTLFSWGNAPPTCDTSAPNGAAFGYSGGASQPIAETGCADYTTSRVRLFRPNAFGLHDMHGNVWEWVEDCYRDRYVETVRDARAIEAEDDACNLRILRGGSWNNSADYLRLTYRLQTPPDTRNKQSGFRVARSIH